LHGLYFDELSVGQSAEITRVVGAGDIEAFAAVSGDVNPVHLDDVYAKATPFGGRIAHGMLSAAYISAVLGNRLPGPGAIYLSQSLKFVKPVRAGDTITARVDVLEVLRERNRARLRTVCVNQRGEEVLSGEAWVMPSKAPVVYEERRPASSVAALVLGPWAMAAQAARLWAALVTSAARR